MYEYDYVTMDIGGGVWFNNANREHRDVIARYAAEGWRYVGYIPTLFTGHGGISEIDLVFERPLP